MPPGINRFRRYSSQINSNVGGQRTFTGDSDEIVFTNGFTVGAAAAKVVVAAGVGGVTIGSAPTQLMAFWGATPADQPDTIAPVPTAGSASSSDNATAINSIITTLIALGLIADAS